MWLLLGCNLNLGIGNGEMIALAGHQPINISKRNKMYPQEIKKRVLMTPNCSYGRLSGRFVIYTSFYRHSWVYGRQTNTISPMTLAIFIYIVIHWKTEFVVMSNRALFVLIISNLLSPPGLSVTCDEQLLFCFQSSGIRLQIGSHEYIRRDYLLCPRYV